MLRAAACQRKSGRRFDFFPVFRLARAGEPSLLAGGSMKSAWEICQDKPGAARFPSLPPPHPRPRSDEANTVQRANPRSLHHGCYHVALRGGRGARGACARFPDDRQPPPFFARSCWVGSQEEALDGLRPPLLTFASLLSTQVEVEAEVEVEEPAVEESAPSADIKVRTRASPSVSLRA